MQSIIEKYEAILKKPQPEPFKGYIEELLVALKGSETAFQIQRLRQKMSAKEAMHRVDEIALGADRIPEDRITIVK